MPRGRPRKNPEEVLIRSAELIGWAIGGIEREIMETRKRLAALTAQAAELRGRVSITAGRNVAAVVEAVTAEGETIAGANRKRRRRKMSPEARKRISEMMKKRWAERKKAVK